MRKIRRRQRTIGCQQCGQAVDNSMNKVGDFMDDSTITAR
jgi:osmotically-inducible protein OsmY